MELLAFELTLHREREKLTVGVRAPAGEATSTAPFSILESVAWGAEPGPDSPFGQQLFECLFPPAIRERYRESLGMARERGARLAISLHCDDPGLSALPWEMVYDPTEGRPLAASLRTPFCRTLSLARPPVALAAQPPLRLLVAAASPAGYPRLDITGELKRLEQELQPLLERELLQMRVVSHATPDALRGALGEAPHLLHLISHGRLDADGRVELVLEDKYGDALALPAGELAAALSGVRLRLALLMACHSAGSIDIGLGLGALGPLLLGAGVGAAVVLQAALSDQVAIAFSGALYRALAAGEPIATAVNMARQDVWAARRTGAPDWAVPVLFTRDPAGRVLIPEAAPPVAEETSHNLPLPPTPLVGRTQEVAELGRQLRQEAVRLVTLTGPGGTGKTRLALEVAHRLLPDYEDGVFFISLAPLQEPQLVPGAIAQALDVQESGGEPILETLKRALAKREMLLVLDNFEHLVEAAPVISQLLGSAAGLNVLATSRERLRLRGERHYPVEPLSTPPVGEVDRGLTPDEALSFPAIELFRQRAQAALPTFELRDANVQPVTEICARLDGLPLAIELAAARLPLFGQAEALLNRLQRGLKLKGGARDLPERQQTQQATIQWSYDLLAPEEQKLFRRLAVFIGGRTLQAVEAACNADGELELDVLDGMQALLDKSLLRREASVGGEPRYVMLQTIHDFAGERLEESGEAERVHRAHADYFVALAEEAEPHLRGPEQAQWLERLEREHDNLRAALRLAQRTGAAEFGLRLTNALWRFWLHRNYLSAGRQWMETMLAKGSAAPAELRAKVLNGMAALAQSQGDLVAARALFEASLALRRELDDHSGIAGSAGNLGNLMLELGDYEQATVLLEESLSLYRALSNKSGMANALNGLAFIAMDQGNYREAQSLLEESLDLRRAQEDQLAVGMSLNGLGLVALYQEDYERAEQLFEKSLDTTQPLQNRQFNATVLNNRGIVATRQGELTLATSIFTEILHTFLEIEDRQGVARCLEALAAVAGARRQSERAVRLWGAAEALRETLQAPLPAADQPGQERAIDKVRTSIATHAFEQAWGEGRAMSLEEAVAYALNEESEDS